MNQSVPRVVKELLGQLKTLNMLKALVECESNLEDLSEQERKGPPREAILICYYALCTMRCTMHYAVKAENDGMCNQVRIRCGCSSSSPGTGIGIVPRMCRTA